MNESIDTNLNIWMEFCEGCGAPDDLHCSNPECVLWTILGCHSFLNEVYYVWSALC